ncbi:MAG TPA: hypothetical protein VGR26_02790 [Acidimicrobiales bacterium]|nr:hypothetical protein [Acidimicrobiales bacterium]
MASSVRLVPWRLAGTVAAGTRNDRHVGAAYSMTRPLVMTVQRRAHPSALRDDCCIPEEPAAFIVLRAALFP